MAELYARKRSPASVQLLGEEGVEFLRRVGYDKDMRITVSVPRNAKFHRKMLGLLRFAYDNWEPPHNGNMKSFDTFRRELIILAGYSSLAVTLDGYLEYVADSIAYDKCPQEKAERMYSDLLDVISQKIFAGHYDRERLDELTEQWLRFT